MNFRGDFGERAPLDPRIEEIAGFDQRRARHAGRRLDDSIFHRAVLGDQDRQRPVRLEAHELDVFQPRLGLVGQDDTGAAGHIGKQRGGLGERPLEAAFFGAGARVRVDARPILAGEIAEIEKSVDEESEALLGRQSPGGRVRGVDQSEFLEILHHVANRGRRQRGRQQAREMARAQGFAGREIGLDDAAEDFARTGVEIGQRAGFGRGLVGEVGHGLENADNLRPLQAAARDRRGRLARRAVFPKIATVGARYRRRPPAKFA